MPSEVLAVAEITASDLEAELRSRADVVLLDTRRAEDFAAWRIPGARNLRNVPQDQLLADPDTWLEGLPPSARARVICYAGIGSRRVAAALAGRFDEVRSVTGGMIGWSRVLQSGPLAVPGPFRVTQFRREARGCLSYLVSAGDEALVVDPAPDVAPYLAAAEAEGLRITRVFDTHVHADHVSGARRLATAAGAALHISEAALRRGLRYDRPVESVVDGALLPLGPEHVTVLALPGHTSDMTGLLLGDAALVAGDSVFAESVARPDLEGGLEGADEAARELHATLSERIGSLPDDTLLLPCHYPGGRLPGPLTARLGDVRADVEELALDRDAFVARVIDQLPPTPSNHLRIIAVNLGEALADDEAARLEVGVNRCAAKRDWAA